MAKGTKAPAGDADDFLNETSPVVEDVVDTEGLDLTQIPPPTEAVITNSRTDTVKAPKPKGDTKHINFSRFGPNKRPLTTDLSDEMLPPITKKRQAIYQLLGLEDGASIDKRIIEDQSSRNSRFVDTSDVEMHHTYSIYDQFEKDFGRQQKVVTYYDGVQRFTYTDPINKENRSDVRQKVGIPKFVHGQVVVDIMKNYHQYLWWELHPANKTNKFRDKSKPASFERIDLKMHNPHTEMVKRELRMDALNYIRSLHGSLAVNLATALDIPTLRQQPADIKNALYALAEVDPEKVLYKAPDKYMSSMIMVTRAIDLGLIDFDAMRKHFYFAQNVVEPLYIVPMDESPINALAKFLVDNPEGKEVKEKIEQYIYYWI